MSINRERLYASDQTRLAVGVEVYIDTSQGRRYGLIVQMGDEDTRPGCVLVYEGPDHEYPAWWSESIVTPSRMGRGRVTDRRLDQRLSATPTASPTDPYLRGVIYEAIKDLREGAVEVALDGLLTAYDAESPTGADPYDSDDADTFGAASPTATGGHR